MLGVRLLEPVSWKWWDQSGTLSRAFTLGLDLRTACARAESSLSPHTVAGGPVRGRISSLMMAGW